MRHLLVIAAITALAFAKPEFYKEKEDFQYSRSSSDEGSKSGFYGAQRGNMGGNYEKAHNMDGLAQHQMSGLVRNVEGELGNGYKMRTGSVYSAANSKGIYGSGNYDLGNLQGRNFKETESFDNSHSSSMSQGSGFRSQSRLNSDAYGSNSRAHSSGYRGYQAGDQSQQYMQTDNLQSADNLQISADRYGYGSEGAQYSSTGFQSHHGYDQSSANLEHSGAYGTNSRSRILTTAPVRIVVRPGNRVTVPLTAQAYDADHTATSFNLDHSNINREAELVNTDGQQLSYRPSNSPKHYESSYSYHKEWEKQNIQPINVPGAVPTENPFPAQREAYGENQQNNLENIQQTSNVDAYNSQSSNAAFTANTQSANQARYQANTKHSSSSSLAANTNEFNTGRRSTSLVGSSLLASNDEYNAGGSSSLLASNSNGYKAGSSSSLLATNTNGYNTGANAANSGNLVEFLSSKPKSYHSSYSYHKSWERQGDPYIIQPAGSGSFDGQTSQKLTAASANRGAYSSHNYGSQYKQAYHSFSQNGLDCDEDGHARVVRSSNPSQEPELQAYQNMYQGQDEYGQQTQSRLENLEDLGQQTQNQWDNLQNFGQQEQSNWENSQDLGQQIHNQWDNLHDLGQQPQHQWDNLQHLGQQTQEKFDKLEDLGQQPQSQWDIIESQQTEQKFDTLENMGQQTQDQWGNMQEVGQETQGKLDKMEDLGQQTQAQWDKIENFDQQSQNKLDKIEDLGQQPQTNRGSTQRQNNNWQKLEDLNQHTQSDLEQQIQTHGLERPKIDSYGQEFDTFAQQERGPWNVFDHNNTQDSPLTDKQYYSGNNLSQKEVNKLTWNNLMLHLHGIQQEISHFDVNNHTPIHTSNKNVGRPNETPKAWMHNFGSSEIVHNQQTQNAWNIIEEETKQQKPFEQNENSDFGNANWYDHHLQTQTEKSSHTQIEQNSYPLGGPWDKIDGKATETKNTQDEQYSSPLGGLWDKIDGIAKETLKDNDEDDVTPKSNKIDSTYWPQQETNPSVAHNTQEQLNPQVNENSLSPDVVENQDKNQRPIDVGRGDIGSDYTDLNSETSEIYKTPKEIEVLSLTRKSNEPSPDSTSEKNTLNILTDDELKIVQDLRKKLENQENDEISITSMSPITSTDLDRNTLDLNENEEKLVQAIQHKFIFNQDKEQTSIPFNTPTSDIYEHQLKNTEETAHLSNSNPMSHQKNVYTELDQENIGYEQTPEVQQNMEQQLEDFQQTQDLQSQSQLENFGQQLQSGWNSEDNLAQVLDQQLLYLGQFSQKNNENQINKEIKEIEATRDTKTDILTTPEPFWKSVGNKLSNAKNKVISWFS